MFKSILPFALLLAGVHAAPAQADMPRDVRVTYGDLNLASKSGTRELDRRISRAIDEVCSFAAAEPGRTAALAEKQCRARKQGEVATQREAALASARTPVNVAASAY